MSQLTNFFCVGAQKSGTTTLHDILNQHPEICLPTDKETKFFQRDDRFNKGLEYYKEHFSLNLNHKIIGEIDPEYMYFNYIPKRIHDILGADVKLIFLLRNPIDRAFSHFLMSKRRGYEDHSFSDAILLESDRISKDDSQSDFSVSNRLNFSYLDRGYYSRQIKEYLKYFKKENMLFILFEDDLISNRAVTINKILSFLEISTALKGDIYLKSNAKGMYRYKRLAKLCNQPNFIKRVIKCFLPNSIRIRSKALINKMNHTKLVKDKISYDEKKQILKKYYRDEISNLEVLINRSLDNWYN